MNYTIKPLSFELADTFVDYLGALDFNYAPHWATCFCTYYYNNCSSEQWMKRTGEENRTYALDKIKDGTMKGYLAFDGDKCIGWCNANDVHKFVRIEKDLEHIVKDNKVGSIICFVIHQEYRGQGIARLLLRRAVDDFKDQGFDAVITVPVENTETPEKQYRGALNMYKELGFKEVEKDGNTTVMWLDL
ncbi:GNAT family N-acetyltransferase [Clostridium sp. YIM B02505]|uniref:GNAT family N-acetyltransferase n=1 Tax=Clostridium yunnanense TaxID=2800325 RepID=A0ABS1ES36_9CLOT|nr:GNAT family N-acetyltransferase [Clostridium yunnanense]MBK1812144.1 GNAT family N-acetyltransferase [Clostridium yunnanense]